MGKGRKEDVGKGVKFNVPFPGVKFVEFTLFLHTSDHFLSLACSGLFYI